MLIRRLAAVAAFAGLVLNTAQAEVFTHPYKGYSFQTPAQWRLANPDFMLMSASGASLMESDLPPRGEQSLENISKTAGMIACIGADYETTDERFDLSGDAWKGLVTVFREPARYGRPQRHVLQLVAQHGNVYRLFYLAVPTREWLSNREPFKNVLGGLRFLPS